jgi:hypothetical protein
MKNKRIENPVKIIRAGLILLLVSSCSPEYIPNMTNTPMFEEKGELQSNLAVGVSGTDLQLAYALTDKIGIMGNGSFYDETSDTTEEFHKHNLYELGVGYYDQVGNNLGYEIYAGMGTGKIKGYDENRLDSPVSDASLLKFFIQPSAGFKSDVFDLNLATRWALLRTDYTEGSVERDVALQPFFEPVLTGRLGFRYIKLVSQAGVSLPLKNNPSFDYQPFIFNVGLHFNVNVLGD